MKNNIKKFNICNEVDIKLKYMGYDFVKISCKFYNCKKDKKTKRRKEIWYKLTTYCKNTKDSMYTNIIDLLKEVKSINGKYYTISKELVNPFEEEN